LRATWRQCRTIANSRCTVALVTTAKRSSRYFAISAGVSRCSDRRDNGCRRMTRM
jgi:hypothetical protein